MSLTHIGEAKTIVPELLEPSDLRALTNTLRFKRTDADIDAALRGAASRMEAQSEIIERQSRLIGMMRVALQPFAMTALSWPGHDSDVVFDGKGFTLTKGNFRTARKLWGTRP